MDFDRKAYANMFKTALAENRIKKSQETFKMKLFLTKAENSLLIAKHVNYCGFRFAQPAASRSGRNR